jgi:chemotaxis signal transduction protein
VPGSTIILEVAQGDEHDGGGAGTKRLIGFTVDEVMDMVVGGTGVGDTALEDRKDLPGVDPTLVRAVGRRNGEVFIVLDVAALLGPILTS